MAENNNGYMSQRTFESLEEMIIKLNNKIKEQVSTINNYNEIINKGIKTPFMKFFESEKNYIDQDLGGKTFEQIVDIVKELKQIVITQNKTILKQEVEIKQLQSIKEQDVVEQPKEKNSTGELSTEGIFDEPKVETNQPLEDLSVGIDKIF